MDFLALWNSIYLAELSLADIFASISTLFNYVFADLNIIAVNEFLRSLVSVAVPYLPIAYMVLSLILALFGKKIFALPRFLAFFFLGFVLGTHLLAPVITPVIPQLPAWVIGVVIATVASVLSKFIYIVLYVVAVGYPTYYLTFLLVPEDVLTVETGLIFLALGVAVVAIVIMLLLRGFIEMAGTSALGGFIIAESIKVYWDYTALDFFSGIEWVPVLAITLIIALVGFIVQVKTRERY